MNAELKRVVVIESPKVAAKKLNALHDKFLAAGRTTIEIGIQIGGILEQQKDRLDHGKWIPWIEENLSFDRTTAFRYMKLFQRQTELKCCSVQHLTEAYRMLSSGSDEPGDPPGQQIPDEDPEPGPEKEHKTRNEARNYDGDEWCTPVKFIALARGVMGDIDLDPATNEIAQKTIKAGTHYTKDDDGLEQDWFGNVWLNPPYSGALIKRFIEKMIEEYEEGDVEQAIVLVNNSTDTAWCQSMLRKYTACFPDKRINFDHPDTDSTDNRQGQVIFYLGQSNSKFIDTFNTVGAVVAPF